MSREEASGEVKLIISHQCCLRDGHINCLAGGKCAAEEDVGSLFFESRCWYKKLERCLSLCLIVVEIRVSNLLTFYQYAILPYTWCPDIFGVGGKPHLCTVGCHYSWFRRNILHGQYLFRVNYSSLIKGRSKRQSTR